MALVMGRNIAALLSAALLASCASMSPEECKRADWRDVGLRDGLRGETLAYLDERVQDCGKVDVEVNTTAYLAGREQGLASYCRLENAVPLGLSGASYAGVCPALIDAAFQARYQMARAVYELRNEVRSLDDRTESLERRLRDINRNEDSRLRAASTEAERARLHREMDEERNHIRDQLSETDRRLRRKRDELRAAEYNLSGLR